MHKKVYALLFMLFSSSFAFIAQAQPGKGSEPVEMADRLRADGKIYVVITILVIILLGLILYVARLDRKISRLEKEIK